MSAFAAGSRVETIARIVYPVALGLIAYMALWVASLFDEPPGLSLTAVLFFVSQVVVIGEGVRLLSRRLERRWPWHEQLAPRLWRQLLCTATFAIVYALAVYAPMKLWEIARGAHDTLAWPHLAITALLAFIFALALNALYALLDFYASWQRALRDAEQLRGAALRAELDALKAQINPHFLFNSLNAVHGLIASDPPGARTLVLELSDVLRYALTHGNRDLVPLSQELEFLAAYRTILETRHGAGLRIDFETPDADECAGGRRDGDGSDSETGVQLPPLTLQLLVENAVRHNRITPGDGLLVRVERSGDRLHVSNPIKPKHGDTAGAGTGLANIDQRYRLLGAPGITVQRDAGVFRVSVSLLPCTHPCTLPCTP